MTLSPVENWHGVKARPDLPPYVLNTINADPFSNAAATDNHHLFRRSLGREFRDAWWVELPDGTILPNRVGLSLESHGRITENKAAIFYDQEKKLFYWRENVPQFVAQPLNPQPGPAAVVHDGASFDAQLDLYGGEVPHSDVVTTTEEVCKPCNGTGRRRKAAKTEPKRRSAVKSIRAPRDAGEDGIEVLETLIAAHRERLAPTMGWSPTVADYFVLVCVLAEALQ